MSIRIPTSRYLINLINFFNFFHFFIHRQLGWPLTLCRTLDSGTEVFTRMDIPGQAIPGQTFYG
jgi:hypothetical protein